MLREKYIRFNGSNNKKEDLMDIKELGTLYQKIRSGEATEMEKAQYEIGIRTSCMDERILRSLVERGELPTDLKSE